MRPTLQKCVPPHLILLDFLAPRLYATSRARPLANNVSRPLCQTTISRTKSISATARVTTTKPSILDVTNDLEGDLSSYATRMQKCALEGNVLGVWSAYERIHNKHPRIVLGPQHYGATSLMLVKLFANVKITKSTSGEELKAMEELAFVCAGTGFVEGFRQMMLWRLANGETGKVIDAYEQFERTVLVLDESGLEKAMDVQVPEEAIPDETDAPQPRHENPDISQLDVANIMAITVAAYAAEDRFYDALHFIIQRPSHRISNEIMDVFEDELRSCGINKETVKGLALATRSYVDAGGLARIVQTPEVFKAHLRNLREEKRLLNRLDKLTGKLKAAFSGKYFWAAMDESQRSPTRPVVVSERVWAYLIHAYVAMRHDGIAQEIWAQVIRYGGKPGIHMWNALLEGYRDSGRAQKLLHTWELMKKEGIRFDSRSYGAKLGCLCQDRKHGQYSLKLFEEFKKTNPSREESLFVYNTVLNGLLAQREAKSAVALLHEMKTRGPEPDIISYNTFIAQYARGADIRAIGTVVRDLTEAGVAPDVFTFTSILTAFLKAGVPNGAERLLQVMNTMGVKQNVATYSAIIDAQVRDGTKEGIVSAWEVLQQMERMRDIKPNMITYTSFLAGVHRSVELEKGLITSISSDIVQTIKKRGMRLKLGTYHILFKACLENPNAEALEFFMDYYNMSQRSEITFWHDTWYVILDGLIRRGEWALAREMKDQMVESGFDPMWGVLRKMRLIQDWEVHH